LCLPVPLPGGGFALALLKTVLMAFVYCIPKNQELLPSSTLLTVKENRNKIKVGFAALCQWYSYSTGKT